MNKLSQQVSAEIRAFLHPQRSWPENAEALLAQGEWEAMLILWLEQQPYHRALYKTHACLSAVPDDSVWQRCHADIAQWLREPDEALRWRIFQHGNLLGFSSPLGALALSLFWSQGSMTPTGLDAVYPDPELSPAMLLCSLKSSCLMLAIEEAPLVGARALMAQLQKCEVA